MIASILGYFFMVGFFALEFFLRREGAARSLKAGPSDRGTTILIGFSYGVSILLPPILNYFSIGRSPEAILVGDVGVALMLAGLGMRLWSMRTLGRYYTRTLLISEEQPFITKGPYRVIRHPGYLGTLLVMIGLSVAEANWIAVVVVASLMLVAYHRRMNAEEAMLGTAFGDGYQGYKKHTWRLLPPLY